MRTPYGLRRDNDGELANDFPVQRNLEGARQVIIPDLPSVYSLDWKIGPNSGRLHNVRNPFIGRAFYKSIPRSTLPSVGGYRPTTAYERTQQYIYAKSLVLEGQIRREIEDRSVRIELKDFVFPLSLTHSNFNKFVSPRLFDKIRTYDTQIGVTLGESRETLSWLLSRYKSVTSAFSAFKRKDASGLRRLVRQAKYQTKYTRTSGQTKRLPKEWTYDDKTPLGVADAANLWMEFRYGLMPLWYDINNIYSDLTKQARVLHRLYRLSVGHGERRSISIPEIAVHPIVPLGTLSGTLSIDERQRNGYVLYNKDGYQKVGLDGTLQAANTIEDKIQHIIDPASTAWELIPYSFVLDWFVPVGNALQVFGSLYDAVEIVDGYERHDFINPVPSFNFISEAEPLDISSQSFTGDISTPYVRRFSDTFPLVNLTLDINARSLTHMIDGVILLTQRLRR